VADQLSSHHVMSIKCVFLHTLALSQLSLARAGASSAASLTVSAKGIAFPSDIEHLFANYTTE
jgi:hypothetical protein